MQQEPEPRASRLISEDPYEDEVERRRVERRRRIASHAVRPLPFDDEEEEAESGSVAEPFLVANDLVLLARSIDNGTLDPDVSPFILQLAKASRAFVGNIELRIIAAAALRQAKAARDLQKAVILANGVLPNNHTIDGKTVEIREAQLAVLCANDDEYTAVDQHASVAECDLEAATLRADACRELSRSIRAIILALTAPLSAASGTGEETR